jgi:hypothetical protein
MSHLRSFVFPSVPGFVIISNWPAFIQNHRHQLISDWPPQHLIQYSLRYRNTHKKHCTLTFHQSSKCCSAFGSHILKKKYRVTRSPLTQQIQAIAYTTDTSNSLYLLLLLVSGVIGEGSSVNIVTRLCVGWPRVRGTNLRGGKKYLLLQNIQTRPWVQPAIILMGSGCNAVRRWSQPLASIYRHRSGKAELCVFASYTVSWIWA